MYPLTGKFRTYDFDKVQLHVEGFKLAMEPQPGRVTKATTTRTISHNGGLEVVHDTHRQYEADWPALKLFTDGDKVLQVLVNVLQGSESEDELARYPGARRTFFLADLNDAKGPGNSWEFAGIVRLPQVITFGPECTTRLFVIDVVELEEEGDDDEVDDWSTRAFDRGGRPLATEVSYTVN